MRTFIAISSWLLWAAAVLLWIALLFIRVVDAIPPVVRPPEQAASYTNLFVVCLTMMTGLATAAYLALWLFWRRAGRTPGVGFWLVSVFLYLCVAMIPVSGFPPYFAVGDRSVLQGIGLVLGALFLVLSIPRLLPGTARPTRLAN